MSELTKPILRNNETDPLSQFYNRSEDEFQVQEGENGASNINVKSMSPLVASSANIGVVTLDGTEVTGVTQLTGGTGSKGLLSSIFKKLSDIATSLAGILNVKIDQTTDGVTNRTVSKISQTVGENVVVLGTGSSTIGTVKIDGTTNTVKIDATNNAVAINHMDKGAVTIAHNAISATTTSAEISTVGFNAIIVHCIITSGTWNISVQGATTTGGNFLDSYDGANKLETGAITTSRNVLFRGVTDFTKIVATNTVAGTCTIKVQPINL